MQAGRYNIKLKPVSPVFILLIMLVPGGFTALAFRFLGGRWGKIYNWGEACLYAAISVVAFSLLYYLYTRYGKAALEINLSGIKMTEASAEKFIPTEDITRITINKSKSQGEVWRILSKGQKALVLKPGEYRMPADQRAAILKELSDLASIKNFEFVNKLEPGAE